MNSKKIIELGLYTITVVLFVTSCSEKLFSSSNPNKLVSEVAGSKLLSVEEMAEDLEYAIGVLGDVHPQTYHGFSQKQKQLIRALRAKTTKPMEARKFYFIINELFFSFKDGHTHLYPMKSKQNRFVDAELIWLQDGLYVKNAGNKLKQGDKVIAIGNRATDELLRELEHIIPAENLHYVRYRAGINLTHEATLSYLNLIKDNSVKYTVQRDNNEVTLNMPLTTKSSIISKQTSKPWVRFQIDKQVSLGILILDKCIYNDKYKNKLMKFFTEVKKNNIQHVAVDVRKNGGGNSQVVDEFLSYLDIKKYKSFSMEKRYSKATKEQRNTTKAKGYYKPMFRFNTRNNRKCSNKKLIFNGKLYILVSAKTFSSGNWFAVVVKDNELGTIIGEPTGNQPTSYGDVIKFQLPNTGFCFVCSYKKWIRPNTRNDPEDALYPDITIYTTIEDILQNRDSQVKKLKEIIQAQ